MELKLIDKQGKQSISEQVKRRKLLNHLLLYIEDTLIPQIKEVWTFEYLVQQVEAGEVLEQHVKYQPLEHGHRAKHQRSYITLPTTGSEMDNNKKPIYS